MNWYANIDSVLILVCAAMMDDSSSVTAAGRRSLKKSLEAKVAMGIPEKGRSQNIWKGSMDLNKSALRERVSLSQQVKSRQWEKLSLVKSIPVGIILYIIAVQLVVYIRVLPRRF